MLKNLFTVYNPFRYATVLVYMLQNTEYQVSPYFAWYWRTQNFARVMYRRQLIPTKAARLLRLALLTGMLCEIALGIGLIWYGVAFATTSDLFFGLAALVASPVVWAHLVTVPLLLGRWFVMWPHNLMQIRRSDKIFQNHPGVKIAVAGSYGKTSMKELLKTVLGEGKKVAATPANKNVAISHAQFAASLDGDEDVLIIEYGESKPGDIARFAKATHPTHGFITGLAPAHLDHYRTVERAAHDIFSLADFVAPAQLYTNGDSQLMQHYIDGTPGVQVYDASGALGWKVSKLELSPSVTSFKLAKGKHSLQLTSGLLGRHQVGPLSIAAALALELGLTDEQVIAGIAKARPFEHRMQPYQLGGAWIIDDTYNGNLEGIRAGTRLLAGVEAKRKLYVTPGLVDQGRQTKPVHLEVGELIAAAQPDMVVLMQNSVTKYIQEGLAKGEYAGEVYVEADPLHFYTNLEHFVAAGDVVLMQNDWTDNYA